MNSKQSILDKIIADGKAVATQNEAETAEKIEKILSKARDKAAEEKAKAEAVLESDARVIVERRVTVARLDAKKTLMQAKKQGVDRAFEAARSCLCALDDKTYLSLIRGMIKLNAEDGDVVVAGKGDGKRVSQDFVSAVAKEMGIDLKLSAKEGNFNGGILLEGARFDKNLTFAAELQAVRDGEESEIAKVLYEE